ncbi:hypothetical protein DM02DRAFT_662312 [Periconia macrospinosa]|uniref:Uncharacterized protein n=1 Tax=Periconia macrospinosa TaxID=97972 RepID=A0A2V1D517_9PLEO|nr:hypothetical protein DM02DRAFT_662312 [Periconia macrospinosa]
MAPTTSYSRNMYLYTSDQLQGAIRASGCEPYSAPHPIHSSQTATPHAIIASRRSQTSIALSPQTPSTPDA